MRVRRRSSSHERPKKACAPPCPNTRPAAGGGGLAGAQRTAGETRWRAPRAGRARSSKHPHAPLPPLRIQTLCRLVHAAAARCARGRGRRHKRAQRTRCQQGRRPCVRSETVGALGEANFRLSPSLTSCLMWLVHACIPVFDLKKKYTRASR